MTGFPYHLEIFQIRVANSGTGVGSVLVDRVALTEPGAYSLGRLPDNDIVLSAPQVSREHAYLIASEDGLDVVDRDSRFGVFIGARRVDRTSWVGDEPLRIDPFEIRLVREQTPPSQRQGVGVALDKHSTLRAREEAEQRLAEEMRFPKPLFADPIVATSALRASNALYCECEYIAVGGGLGSFAWVDHLRCFGVNSDAIRVIGDIGWNPDDANDHPRPYQRYQELCRRSQIPDHERLRSNSISTPDNIWGFPGYASRETWRDLKQFRLGGLKHILQVFGEPALAQSYTPRSADVFAALDREAARIGWKKMCVPSRVIALRKTDDGRYAIAFRLDRRFAPDGKRNKFAVARFIHIATGYPAYRTDDDLFRFNRQHIDRHIAVKAYDEHERVYFDLGQNRQPFTVAVRGRGIVASRILQRLYELRARNNNIRIVHQMRRAIGPRQGNRLGWARRPVFNNTELQPFNWPKACWGGELKQLVEDAAPDERPPLYRALGGTTTADRRDWKRIIQRGLAEGWYSVLIGQYELAGSIEQNGRTRIRMSYAGPDGSSAAPAIVDYVIDCIGLIGNVENSYFLHDLLTTYRLQRNGNAGGDGDALGGVAVTPDFEIVALRNGGGHVYAAGQITGLGPYAAVDSFLGLQYAALRSTDHLADVGAPGVSRFGPFRSFRQWVRWCGNRPP